VQACRLDDIFPPASFDIITAWAVLEHVYDLKLLMKEIGRLLKMGGIFIALTSNLNSLPALYMRQDDIPRHLNLFTKKSMALLCRKYMLNPISWDFHDNIYHSGTHRGLLIFLLKQAFGESFDDIVSQHRSPGRREIFCTMLKGRPSLLIKTLCKFDRIFFTPFIDYISNTFAYGFTMTVTAKKYRS